MTTSLTAQRIEKGNLVIEGVPDKIPIEIEERILQYQNTRGAAFRDWAPDGKGIIIGTRFAEVAQSHYVAKPGAARQQLTFFNEPVKGSDVCPDLSKNGFIFAKDIGGNEQNQLYFFDIATSKSKLLTDGESRNSNSGWNKKGDKFLINSNKRNGKDFDIYVSTLEQNPNEAKLVFEANGWWYASDWSFDDKHLIITHYISANESKLYVLNIETSDYYQIGNTDKKIAYRGGYFAAEDKGVYYVSDEDEEFKKLRYFDLETKQETILTGNLNWNIDEIEISKDGSKVVFSANEGGYSTVYILNTTTNQYTKLKNIPSGQVYGMNFNDDGTQLGFTVNSSIFPSDVFVYSFENNESERWTFSEVGGLNTEKFIEPALIEYETFDKVDNEFRKIPAFVYMPEGEGPFPTLITIHGGPEGQFVPTFQPILQYILNELKIAIIAPNVRGSNGYGKSFLLLDNGFKREDSVKDIGALLNWISTQPKLDAAKVGVTGGSYGGYMSYASMIHYSDKITCGVSRVGISNFVTFLENTKEYRRDLRRAEYGDEREPKMRKHLQAISPTNHAEKLTKPIFIVQGANDPRVPLSEAEQMLAKVKENGQPVWYLMAKDEGHGFRKKSNIDYYYSAYMLFLEQFLLN